MTRADKIKEYIKMRYGVELDDDVLEETNFRLQGCDGFACAASDCVSCKYNNFWEQEDKECIIK